MTEPESSSGTQAIWDRTHGKTPRQKWWRWASFVRWDLVDCDGPHISACGCKRGAMGKMDDGDFYGQVCRDENIKSGTGWRVVRVVGSQERERDGGSVNWWAGSAIPRFRKGVYTDPELSGSSKRPSEDVPEGKPNKQSIRHRRGRRGQIK
jgi:hypothetical protein